MTVFKLEIISQCLLIWLKYSQLFFFVFFFAQYQKCSKYFLISSFTGLLIFYILQHGCKFSSWLMVNNLIWYFVHLQSATFLNPCCKKRATKCLQWTIALFQYKLFINLFPISVIESCEVVIFKPWAQYVWSKSGILFFLATCATSFRIMTLYFTTWVNKYSAKDSDYLVFARS